MAVMSHIDLCSGIGGFALGFEQAQLSTPVLFCDIELWSRKILAKHWPQVPIAEDVKELANDPDGLIPDTDPRNTILTAGYPCQPFSGAGKRRGTQDPRHIYPYISRIIAQKRPAWVVLENVYGHLSLGLDEVLNDLESKEYATRTFILPSGAIVGAPHKRDRLWIIAHTHSFEWRPIQKPQQNQQKNTVLRQSISNSSSDVADTRRKHGGKGNATELDEEQTKWASRTVYAESSSERQSDATNTKSEQRDERQHEISREKVGKKGVRGQARTSGQASADTNSQRGRGRQTKRQDAENVRQSSKHQRTDGERMETGQSQSSLCRMDDGLSSRLDGFDGWHREPEDIPRVAVGIKDRANRLKGLGNAILPQIAQKIGEVIKVQHEKSR